MTTRSDDDALVAEVRAGNRRSAARLISRIEAGDDEAGTVLQALYAAGGGTPVVGLTGPPGAGKSTLADQLVAGWRGRGERVAVLAVDPSSPLSGGALLGDRVRMARHNTDAGVFIRSMSARGRLGGLSGATGDALIVLDAMGFDRILLESVGTGQSEIDILHHADVVTALQPPAAGDAIQAMKSGLLEVADILVVNKMDTPGAERMLSLLREAVAESNHHPADGWEVPVLATQANAGAGIEALLAALDAHAAHMAAHLEALAARRRKRARVLLLERLAETIRARHAARESAPAARFEQSVEDILMRRCDPRSAALRLIGDALGSAQPL